MTGTKTITQTESKKYPCVFKLTEDCPVKAEFKLKPENLKPWCEICPIRHQEIKKVEAKLETDQDKKSQTNSIGKKGW